MLWLKMARELPCCNPFRDIISTRSGRRRDQDLVYYTAISFYLLRSTPRCSRKCGYYTTIPTTVTTPSSYLLEDSNISWSVQYGVPQTHRWPLVLPHRSRSPLGCALSERERTPAGFAGRCRLLHELSRLRPLLRGRPGPRLSDWLLVVVRCADTRLSVSTAAA